MRLKVGPVATARGSVSNASLPGEAEKPSGDAGIEKGRCKLKVGPVATARGSVTTIQIAIRRVSRLLLARWQEDRGHGSTNAGKLSE